MAPMVMPKNVVLFERLGYATVVIGNLAGMLASWSTFAKFAPKYPYVYPLSIALAVLVQLFWIWLVARKRQNWARWLSVIVIAVSILFGAISFKTRYAANPSAGIVSCLIYAMWIIQFSLLFTKEAKAWFVLSPSPPIDGETVSPTEA